MEVRDGLALDRSTACDEVVADWESDDFDSNAERNQAARNQRTPLFSVNEYLQRTTPVPRMPAYVSRGTADSVTHLKQTLQAIRRFPTKAREAP